jgi:hypothetical protein
MKTALVIGSLVVGSAFAAGCVVHEGPPPAGSPVADAPPPPPPAQGSTVGHVSTPATANAEHAPAPAPAPAPAAAAAPTPAAAPAAAAATPAAKQAAPPAKHPYYLHALADLRDARAHLQKQGGDKQMQWDEKAAIVEIDHAIQEIKKAAIDDGKNVDDHVAIDIHQARAGRLHAALDDLKQARNDVDKEEDNAFANGLKARALHAIDEAIRLAEAGIKEAAKLT